VNAELAKNGGRPSPDRKKTNFDNMVTPADIQKLEPQIKNGVWIVVNTGWSKFYVGAPPKNPFMHPYTNGLNYPGFGKAVVETLIAIENKKGVKIAGIVMDNLSVDSGRSGLGSKGNPFGDGWYVHQLGLQRGWKLVENATNLAALRGHKPGQCTLVVGAPKPVSATGTPARLIAMCEKNWR
jgi:kynurenine formamidase